MSWPVDLGDLRRVTPIDPLFGFQRGTPIDRVYVEQFLGEHAADIRGHVLEIGAPEYTNLLGRGVEKSDVLMATEGNPEATIVADLTNAPQIPDDTFDCAILTQTLQFIYDVQRRPRDRPAGARARRCPPRDGAGPDQDLSGGRRAVG